MNEKDYNEAQDLALYMLVLVILIFGSLFSLNVFFPEVKEIKNHELVC